MPPSIRRMFASRSPGLRRPDESPDAAWDTLTMSLATHAVVHETFYEGPRGKAVSDWLARHGAKLVAQFDGDLVYALKNF